jgi:hypothetical protein
VGGPEFKVHTIRKKKKEEEEEEERRKGRGGKEEENKEREKERDGEGEEDLDYIPSLTRSSWHDVTNTDDQCDNVNNGKMIWAPKL